MTIYYIGVDVLIIIEGLDKIGKTTLQQGLLREYDWMFPYRLKRANFRENSFKNFKDNYWKIFSLIQKIEMTTIVKLYGSIGLNGMIADRFHGTEWSYLEEDEDKDLDYIWELDDRIVRSNYPSVLIFLDASVQWIFQKLDEEEKKEMQIERLERYRQRFLEFFERSEMDKIRILVSSHDIQSVLDTSKMFLQNTLYTILDF